MLSLAPPRVRDIFDDDEPEAGAAGASPHAGMHFAGFNDDDGEDFREPSPSTASHSRSPSPTRQPTSRRRQRGSPRAGPHVSPLPVPHRKGRDRSGGAKDVWTFFDPKVPLGAQKRECLFCRCVHTFISFIVYSLTTCRQQHAADPHTGSTKFSASTSTGILRKHLYEHQVDAWVEGCDKVQITIKAKEAAKYVDVYRVRKHQKTGATWNSEPGKKRTAFSQEAFVDAIVEFIVGDDQVSFSSLPLFKAVTLIPSPSTSSRMNSSALSF